MVLTKLTYRLAAALMMIWGGGLIMPQTAQADYSTCTQSVDANGHYTTECPAANIARNDISVSCLDKQNQSTCLDTMPVGGSVARISEDMCYRNEGWSNKRNHNGVDYASTKGTPVLAAADGIAYVNDCLTGGGIAVSIVHSKANTSQDLVAPLAPDNNDNSYTSIYMHLSKATVSNGASVKKGQKIGEVGGTSCSNGNLIEDAYGSHLHFEIRDGNAVKSPASGLDVLNPLCNDIQGLCTQQSTNPFFSNVNQSNYNAEVCRDCKKNPGACPVDNNDKNDNKDDKDKTTSSSKKQNVSQVRGDCVTLYPEDDLFLYAAQSESGNNAGKTNWYSSYSNIEGSGCFGNVPGTSDNGGCSYGFIQMSCGSTKFSDKGISYGNGKHAGGFRNFMQRLQQEKPELYAQLDMGGFEETMMYACSDQAFPKENAQFRAAWEKLGQNQEFYDFQYQVNAEAYIQPISGVLSRKGISLDWNSLSPEVQMNLVKANLAGSLGTVASGLSSKYGNTSLNSIPASDLIVDINNLWVASYENYRNNGGQGTYDAVAARAQKDIANSTKSAQLRESIAANPDKDPNEIAIELFGKRLCEEGEIAKASAGKKPVVSSDATIAANKIAANFGGRDCSVSNYRNSFKDCIFCSIFAILFDTASQLAAKAYPVLEQGIEALVLVGMALWLAMLVLKYVSSFETKDPRNLAKEIFNQAFVVIVVIILLRAGATQLMNLILTPIFETGMQLAQMAVAGSGGETCNPQSLEGINEIEGGLPVSMGQSIVCTIDAIQNKILDIMAVGSAALCAGFYLYSWGGIVIFPHLGFVITGLLLWISALLMLIIYPWLLIDCVLQMCIASIMLPVAVGAYAFKYTRKMFVAKVWGTFLEAMFMFMFLSLVISVLLLSLDSVMAEAFDKKLLEAGTGNNDFDMLLDGIGWWSVNCLKLVFVMLLGWAVLGEAKAFASQFASGIHVESIGSNVGTLAMSGVKGAGVAAFGVGKSAVTKAGGMIGDTLSEKANDFKQSYQANNMSRRMQKLANQGTMDEDGKLSYKNAFGRKFTLGEDGQSYSYKNWRGQTVTKKITKDDQGRSIITVATTGARSGRTTEVSNDGYIRNRIVRDKNGNIISQKTEMTTAAGKYLINNDGTINQVALNNIMQNSAFGKDIINTAVTEQLMRERLPGLDFERNGRNIKSQRISTAQDANGNTIFTVSRTYEDGMIINLSMAMGENNRVMTSAEQILANNEAVLYASDGIINKQSNYRYRQGKIDESSRVNQFSFTNYYNSRYGKPMDSLGYLAGGLSRNDILFGDSDFEEFKEHIATYGNPESLNGFK